MNQAQRQHLAKHFVHRFEQHEFFKQLKEQSRELLKETIWHEASFRELKCEVDKNSITFRLRLYIPCTMRWFELVLPVDKEGFEKIL